MGGTGHSQSWYESQAAQARQAARQATPPAPAQQPQPTQTNRQQAIQNLQERGSTFSEAVAKVNVANPQELKDIASWKQAETTGIRAQEGVNYYVDKTGTTYAVKGNEQPAQTVQYNPEVKGSVVQAQQKAVELQPTERIAYVNPQGLPPEKLLGYGSYYPEIPKTAKEQTVVKPKETMAETAPKFFAMKQAQQSEAKPIISPENVQKIIQTQESERKKKVIGSDLFVSVPVTPAEAKLVPKPGAEYAAATAVSFIGGGIIIAPFVAPVVVGAASKYVSELPNFLANQAGSIGTKGASVASNISSSTVGNFLGRAGTFALTHHWQAYGISLTGGTALMVGAPEVAKEFLSKEEKDWIKAEAGVTARSELEGYEQQQADIRGLPQGLIGMGLPLEIVPGFVPIIGGEAEARRQDIEQYIKLKGLTPSQASALKKVRFAGQLGELGALPIEFGSEIISAAVIGLPVAAKIAGKKIGIKESFKIGFTEAPKFAAIGIAESTSEYAGQSISRGVDITPEGLIFSGGVGAVTAGLGGSTVLSLGIASGSAKHLARPVYGLLSILDPLEPIADTMESVVSKAGRKTILTVVPTVSVSPSTTAPSFTKTVSQTPQQTTQARKKGRAPAITLTPGFTPTSSFVPSFTESIIPTKTEKGTIPSFNPTQAPIPDETGIILPIGTETPEPGTTPQQTITQGDTITNMTNNTFSETITNTPTYTLTFAATPVPTPTTTPTGHIPPLLPFFPTGEMGGKGRGRLFYVNEASIALGALKNQFNFGFGLKTKKINVKKEMNLFGGKNRSVRLTKKQKREAIAQYKGKNLVSGSFGGFFKKRR